MHFFRFVTERLLNSLLVAVSSVFDRMRGQLAFHRARAAFSHCIRAYLAGGAGRRQKSLHHRRANGIPDRPSRAGAFVA